MAEADPTGHQGQSLPPCTQSSTAAGSRQSSHGATAAFARSHVSFLHLGQAGWRQDQRALRTVAIGLQNPLQPQAGVIFYRRARPATDGVRATR